MPRGVIKIRMMNAVQNSRRASVATAGVAIATSVRDRANAERRRCFSVRSMADPEQDCFSPPASELFRSGLPLGRSRLIPPDRRSRVGRWPGRETRDHRKKKIPAAPTSVARGRSQKGSVYGQHYKQARWRPRRTGGKGIAEEPPLQEELHAKLMDGRGSFHTAVTCCCGGCRCSNTSALARNEAVSHCD